MRQILLSFLLLSFQFISAQINLDSGLVACYALNGNAHEPINDLHGIMTDVLPAANRFNVANSAVNINGGNINLSSSSLLKPGVISFAAWVKRSGDGSLLYTETSAGGPAFSLGFEGFVSALTVKKTNNFPITASLIATTSINLNTWFHICVTADYNQIKLYVNGILDNSVNANLTTSYGATKQVYLGRSFSGLIDDARMYNRVLSAAEINLLYTSNPVCVISAQAPVSSFSFAGNCIGNSLSFNDSSSNSPSSWNWKVTGPETHTSVLVNPQFTLNTPGSYTAALISSNAVGSDTAIKTFSLYPLPLIHAVASKTFLCRHTPGYDTSTLTATGGLTYSLNPLPFTQTGSAFVIKPSASTIYTVSGADTNGCVNTTTIRISVAICDFFPNSIAENNQNIKAKVFPNPTSGNLVIDLPEVSVEKYELVNLCGLTVLSGTIEQENKINLNIENLPNGIYFLKLKNDSASRVIKVVKE